MWRHDTGHARSDEQDKSAAFTILETTDHIVMLASEFKLGLFQDADVAGDLWNSKINVRRCVVQIRRSHICANFADSSTAAAIISLDACPRMKDIPALGLWDTVIDVLEPIERLDAKNKNNNIMSNERTSIGALKASITYLRTHISSRWASLSLFEDAEAVINMIMSPNMRHVSRTHRIDLDCLIKWISINPLRSNMWKSRWCVYQVTAN